MKLEHINLTASNLAASVDFYEKLFGFEVRWRGKTSGGEDAVHIGSEDNYLALFETRKSGRAPYDYDAPGVNHFGFVVDSLSPLRERLKEMGVPIHMDLAYEPGKRLYFFDPDGVEIELVEYD